MNIRPPAHLAVSTVSESEPADYEADERGKGSLIAAKDRKDRKDRPEAKMNGSPKGDRCVNALEVSISLRSARSFAAEALPVG